MSQIVAARGMDAWQLLPRSQRFTELYFTDYQHVPTAAAPGAAQKVAFTVHNLEQQTTTYRYALIAATATPGSERQIGGGTLTLHEGQSQQVVQQVIVPPLGNRVSIGVDLSYGGIAPGQTTPSTQTQSIHYWLRVGSAGGSAGNNGSSGKENS